MARAQHRQSVPLRGEERTATSEQRANPGLAEGREGRIEVAGTSSLHAYDAKAKAFGGGLGIAQLHIVLGQGRVDQYADQLRPRNELMQLAEPLGGDVNGGEGHAGDVAAR